MTGRSGVPGRAGDPDRPLPSTDDPDTGPFWAAAADHRLTYQRCRQCGEIVFYPRRHCTRCTDGHLDWQESAGRGTVYSFTVVRQHGHPYFRARVPYVVGLIDLAEGFRMMAEIDAEPAQVRVGQRVSVAWEDHGEVSVPLFRPEGA